MHLIDRARSLAVLVTGSEEARTEVIAEREGLSFEEAAHYLHKRDRDHARFHQHYFTEPRAGTTYDLVVDGSHLGAYAAAGIIVSAFAYKAGLAEQASDLPR